MTSGISSQAHRLKNPSQRQRPSQELQRQTSVSSPASGSKGTMLQRSAALSSPSDPQQEGTFLDDLKAKVTHLMTVMSAAVATKKGTETSTLPTVETLTLPDKAMREQKNVPNATQLKASEGYKALLRDSSPHQHEGDTPTAPTAEQKLSGTDKLRRLQQQREQASVLRNMREANSR